MDPEEEIAAYLRSKGVQRAVLNDMLRNFAHDLAEAIRLDCQQGGCTDYGHPCTCDHAANLIDPEVTDGE